MDRLSAAEEILGDAESWHTCLIYDTFVLKPNTINAQNVAAFIYGTEYLSKKVWTFCCIYWIRQ